jgi:IS5 family transposase
MPCTRLNPCAASSALELNEIALPDEMTILNFRHLLEVHQLTTQLMNTIVLTERNILLKGCAMVDATLTHAPSSTKNADKVRDPEMHQTKKCKQLYFGIKVHVSTDVNRGMVHTVSVTSANAPDKSQLPGLSRDDDRALFCDKGDVDNRLKRVATNKRASREHSSIRSRVEHIFRVMKWQFGYAKARYCGLAKNTAQVITLIGLTNLYLVRRRMAA